MRTRRDLLAGTVGAGAGIACWTVGAAVREELQTTDLRYMLVRNATETRQSVTVLFEADDEPTVWETYTIDEGDVVELDDFAAAETYRLFVRWDDMTPTQRLKTGTRAVAIVLTAVGGGDIIIRDVPFSSLSSAAQPETRTKTTSAE